MILTSRDQALLASLQSYGLLTTRLIKARHFSDIAMTTVLRRLRILEEAGYIQRISGLDFGQNAWSLTVKSAEAFHPKAVKVHFPRFILEHDLKLMALRLRLEESGLVHSWRPEHEIRSIVAERHGIKTMSDRTIPDGLMGIENEGQKESVAVELELSSKNQERYRSIFWDYADKDSLWGLWYVVKKKGIATQLLTARKNGYQRGPYFLWSELDDVMKDPLQAMIYSGKRRFKISEIWTPKTAHSPAHPMSRQIEKE